MDLRLDFDLLAIELYVVLLQYLICTFFRFEGNKSKTSRSLFVFIIHHFKFFYSSVSREELFNLIVGDTMWESAHKYFTIISFLLDISLLGGQLRIAQFNIDYFAVDFMRSGVDCFIR